MQRSIRVLALVAAASLAMACNDAPENPVAPQALPPAPGASGPEGVALATLECSVAVDEEAVSCREVAPAGYGPGVSAALLGLNQIKMASMANSYDSINEIYGFDATMQNLLTYAIGTPDGTTREGSKVYFESGPTAYAYYAAGDTGTVRVHNADGYADYTAGDQPYFFYDTILQPQQVSARKRWEYSVPREVKGFRFSVKIFTSTPVERRVAILPPDTFPAGFYDSANVMLDSPHFGLSRRTLKGIVAVRFNPTATRDERQAAVDVIKGQVVGGRQVSGIEGYYFVRITDDGTGRQMRTAVDTLGKIPSVATAQPEYLWMPAELAAYAEADEGGGDWQAPWRTNPTAANGENWGLEAIAAPSAWGCSVGGAQVKVGVVDGGYFSNPDLLVNTTHAPAMDAFTAFGYADDWHGTAVASIIGAGGNNGQGITGVMWGADLRLYDYAVRDDGERSTVPYKVFWRTPVPAKGLVERRLMQAINDGAHVINLSIAVPPGQVLSVPEADRRREVERMAKDIADLVSSAPNKPLLVIGAGNWKRDAYWSVLPLLARMLPDQAIVVSGVESVTDTEAPLWDGAGNMGSDHNTDLGEMLVQIAAPGESVGVLTPSGHTAKSGTSMSAPLVTGIAGLLKAFDSRLTAGQMKQFLLEGARRGGRLTPQLGTVYVANAYHSLAAASEQPGAPLCGGMPVWRDEELGLVQTRRITGTTAGGVETLFSRAGSDLVPLHGESTIRVDQNFYGWFDGTWMLHPQPRTDLFGSPTNRSKLGQSHDGDSSVTVTRQEVSDTEELYRVRVNGTLLAEVPSTWAKKPTVYQCVYYHESSPGCDAQVGTWYDRITAHTAVGYSPRGDEVVLAIWKQKSTYSVDIPYRCGPNYTYFCRDYGLEITTPASELVFIRISDGQVTRRAGPLRAIKQIGFSDDGQRLVLGTEFTYYNEENVMSTGETFKANTWYCQAQYMARSGTTYFTTPLKRLVPQCYTTATFSP